MLGNPAQSEVTYRIQLTERPTSKRRSRSPYRSDPKLPKPNAGCGIQAALLARKCPSAFFPSSAASAMLSKKLYWRRLTGTINFPPPRLLRIPRRFTTNK